MDLLYFADICAGPGGFSEYMLWRKGWHCKGFGFTLKGNALTVWQVLIVFLILVYIHTMQDTHFPGKSSTMSKHNRTRTLEMFIPQNFSFQVSRQIHLFSHLCLWLNTFST